MFVKFDVTRVTKEADPQTFEAGECYELSASSGVRWIKRNCAHEISEAEYRAHKAATKARSRTARKVAAPAEGGGTGAPDPAKAGDAGQGDAAGAAGGAAGGNA